MDEKKKQSIKYCLLMKKYNTKKKAVQRIGRALYKCDGENEDIDDAKMLLEALS